ncbi:Transmembrane 4 L6 family member 4 [Turdus rufiventris]|nr:Transmembrane 4 L6 family member 4 [Turdus rufiventris]
MTCIVEFSQHCKFLFDKQMFSSIIFAAVGVLGAAYCFSLSAVAIHKGPKCEINGNWTYPFKDGNYLEDHELWNQCKSPANIVPWHLTLFSLLLVMSGVQAVLCAIQALNGLFGTICGDCSCCCGVSNDRCPLLLMSYTHT